MANLELSRAQRLDKKVVEILPSLSRGYAARLIEDAKVKVNNSIQTKPGYKLRPDDVVEVDYDEASEPILPKIELNVIYEDDDCVVIEKPLGLLSHSKGSLNLEPTVASWLRERVTGVTGNRAGIVHRLDRATTGVMICAKKPDALSWLQKQFSERKTKKTYYAVVSGALKPESALIDMPIERNPKAPATFRAGAGGKSAQTIYRTEKVSVDGKYSLLELKPKTGRTHQIRVHLAHIGHPIVGDIVYGTEASERMYLHAAELEITIPEGHVRKVFRSNLPESFLSFF